MNILCIFLTSAFLLATLPCFSQEAVDLGLPGGTETISVNGVSFKMVKVEGGSFNMGTTPDQGEVLGKQPIREASVGTFFIGETEVTQDLWTAVMGTNPSIFHNAKSAMANRFPVENVSLKDCKSFIKKLNKLTNHNFRLPTEEEWEYAARGGKKAKATRFAGSNIIEDVGWYAQNSGINHLSKDWRREELRENECKTHMVAEKAPNELGLYDMTGNVCEWTDTKCTRPGSSKNERRKYIVKGGSYQHNIICCTVSYFGVLLPDEHYPDQGLRLVFSE